MLTKQEITCMTNRDTHLFDLFTRTEASKGMQHRMMYWKETELATRAEAHN
jgi:hypothetical protein